MKMAMYYPQGECPDCTKPIPNNCVHGEECKGCGHVFYLPDGWVFVDEETKEEIGYAEAHRHKNAELAVEDFDEGQDDFGVYFRKDGELYACACEDTPDDF